MNNKELPRGRQTLGMARTTPLPPVREKELAPPPTKEETDKANRGAYAGETRTVEKVGKNRVLKAVLGGGAVVAGGTIAYEAVPAIHQAVDSAFLNHLKGKSLSSDSSIKPEVFNPTADKQTVKAGINTVAVSEVELKKAYREQSSQNTDGRPTVVFPIKFIADGQRVDYEYQKPFSPFADGTVIEKPGTINIALSRNQEISLPAENAEVFQFKPEVVNGKEYFIGVFIKWEQNGEIYGFRIAGADVRTFKSLGDVANTPIVPTRQQGGLDLSGAKNGLKFPLGTSLARVDISSPEVSLNFDKYNPKTGRWESVRPNLVTDNSTGQLRLMVPQDNNN